VTHLPQPSPYHVPVYLATLTSQNAKLAGEIADGRCDVPWSGWLAVNAGLSEVAPNPAGEAS
jgi:hypothetical protein